jgi:hypothetical protein
LLLDLDKGSMSVCQNGRLLGVLQASGLPKEEGLCWAVALADEGDSVRIERDGFVVVEPPTVDELWEAEMWEADSIGRQW